MTHPLPLADDLDPDDDLEAALGRCWTCGRPQLAGRWVPCDDCDDGDDPPADPTRAPPAGGAPTPTAGRRPDQPAKRRATR